MAKTMHQRFAVTGTDFSLSDFDAGATPGMKDGSKARTQIEEMGPDLREWQTKLYAERKQSLLLILQGMDACGKDGVVKHVIHEFYPTSVHVTPFKAPTPAEKRNSFLARFKSQLPEPGNINVFNRSHYEDVGVVKVRRLAKAAVIEGRYDEINAFEQKIVDSGITIIKCFLHVSQPEQRQRMLDRLADPTKRWKFKERDLDESDRWEQYLKAYDIAIKRCSTEAAPWYVIPADHKWYRDWVIAQLILEWFEEMSPEYPKMVELDIPALNKRIKAAGRVAT